MTETIDCVTSISSSNSMLFRQALFFLLVGASLALAPISLCDGVMAPALLTTISMDATITTSLFESCTTIQKESTFTLQNTLLSFTSHFSFPTTMSLAQQQAPSDVWQQPFAMQPFSEYYEITNLDVAGVSSLTLGAIYLFSFMYYHYILEQEQSIALAKQNAKAANNNNNKRMLKKRLCK